MPVGLLHGAFQSVAVSAATTPIGCKWETVGQGRGTVCKREGWGMGGHRKMAVHEGSVGERVRILFYFVG